MFFHFSQNNSGGSFVYSYKRGITHNVVIEADSYKDANSKAKNIGLYFNGCANNIDCDCDCCGDRWYSVDSYEEGDSVPRVYGEPLGLKYKGKFAKTAWMNEGRETVVHYADGTRKWFNADNTLAENQ